uniref:C-type lectin domain-containing protein n=1 Tax=Pelusios castaneus TaxID=367368 RepID=A0A8C8RG48_9SAUR
MYHCRRSCVSNSLHHSYCPVNLGSDNPPLGLDSQGPPGSLKSSSQRFEGSGSLACRGPFPRFILTAGLQVPLSHHVPVPFSAWPRKCPSADLGPPAGPTCPNGWVGFRGKCYYFSEDEGNWTSSQTHCSALNTSLAGIDTWQDMGFMVRHKGTFDHWIGLRRDLGQPWKWANGTEFNNLFPIEGGGGDCAYLNRGEVSSSQCTGIRFWICSKPDVFTEAKQTAGEEAGSPSGLQKL